ncbi:MAG: hypothetical protein JXA28_03260, partial [Bacteroidetes bacterium]|nr:hypothetical protein [Bacteroidota bacterium]
MKAFTSALLPVVFLCVVASAHSAATFTPDSNPAVTSIAALPFASMTSESIASTGILREKHSTRADAPSRTEDPRRTAGLMQQSGIRFIENRGQIAGTDGRVRTD